MPHGFWKKKRPWRLLRGSINTSIKSRPETTAETSPLTSGWMWISSNSPTSTHPRQDVSPPLALLPPILSKRHSPQWTIPLPPELLYFIVDVFIHDDTSTLANLTLAYPPLAPYCRKVIYRSVKIYIRERGRAERPSRAELFVASMQRSPEVLDYIEDLQIHDRGPFMHQGYHSLTEEEHYLCKILVASASMNQLRRFELDSRMTWPRLPPLLQDSLCFIFRLPKIIELSLRDAAIPLDLFSLFDNLQTIELTGEAVGPRDNCKVPPERRSNLVMPKNITLTDTSQTGHTPRFIFDQETPIILLHTECMEISLPGFRWQFERIQQTFGSCESLTHLKIHPAMIGGAPPTLNLAGLVNLKLLSLAADVTTTSTEPFPDQDSIVRFRWLFESLHSLPSPQSSIIEEIVLTIRCDNLRQGLHCDWDSLDILFLDDQSFPLLATFVVDWCTLTSLDIDLKHYEEAERILPALLPNLSRTTAIMMRTTYFERRDTSWN